MTNRRRFIMMVPFTGAALAAACSEKAPAPEAAPVAPAPVEPAAAPMTAPEPAVAPAPATDGGLMVGEAEPTAMALGYVADAARVDKVKHPNFVDGSTCASCVLYQGAAGSERGPCPLFAGKQVSAKGWCASYAKKPS